MSRFAPGAIEAVVAEVIFEPAAPPSVRTVALIAAKAADGADNNRTARLAARSVRKSVFVPGSSALILRAPQVGTAAGVDAPRPHANPAHGLVIPRRCARGSGHPASPGRAPDPR